MYNNLNSKLGIELDSNNTFILKNATSTSVEVNTKYVFAYGGGLSNFTFTDGDILTVVQIIDHLGNYHNIGIVKATNGKLTSYGDCVIVKIV